MGLNSIVKEMLVEPTLSIEYSVTCTLGYLLKGYLLPYSIVKTHPNNSKSSLTQYIQPRMVDWKSILIGVLLLIS